MVEAVNEPDAIAALAASIVARARDYTDPDHVHQCRSIGGDVECEDSPCRCECGAVIDFRFKEPVFEDRITWLAPDGSRAPYPDRRGEDPIE